MDNGLASYSGRKDFYPNVKGFSIRFCPGAPFEPPLQCVRVCVHVHTGAPNCNKTFVQIVDMLFFMWSHVFLMKQNMEKKSNKIEMLQTSIREMLPWLLTFFYSLQLTCLIKPRQLYLPPVFNNTVIKILFFIFFFASMMNTSSGACCR